MHQSNKGEPGLGLRGCAPGGKERAMGYTGICAMGYTGISVVVCSKHRFPRQAPGPGNQIPLLEREA